MADVRLTAIGPDARSYPVACNEKGELLLDDTQVIEGKEGPVGPQGPPGADGADGKDGASLQTVVKNQVVGTAAIGTGVNSHPGRYFVDITIPEMNLDKVFVTMSIQSASQDVSTSAYAGIWSFPDSTTFRISRAINNYFMCTYAYCVVELV